LRKQAKTQVFLNLEPVYVKEVGTFIKLLHSIFANLSASLPNLGILLIQEALSK
ncbi:hypothetical protein HMPREF3213_01829, partial [Heyndrickxia coagulans]